jgi:2-keto-4-pentenoate hydratase/2-oxohepta-3-ene-1,7-dioic acid hydratase in catechol pathway
MNVAGRARAGVVVGDDALDVTGYCELIGEAGTLAAVPRDALDLYKLGSGFLQAQLSRLSSDEGLTERCREAGVLRPFDAIKLNPPVIAPGKILAVGLNYAAHAEEQNKKPPESPLIFSKNVTALIGPEDEIRLPRISKQVDYEAELAVVIGKEARSVRAENAFEHIAGYTILNDVTARDLQASERQWARAKGLDTFAPCGPWLVTTDEIEDPHSLGIELRVNGEVRQESNTSDLIFKIPQVIEFISQDLTLRPGDIISTGTPSGVGVYMQPPVFLKNSDEIDIRVERIGTLRNRVVANKN